MNRLIKDKDIILDGTAPRFQKEMDAFEKLESIEELLEIYEIKDLVELHKILQLYWDTCHLKKRLETEERIFAEWNKKEKAENGR